MVASLPPAQAGIEEPGRQSQLRQTDQDFCGMIRKPISPCGFNGMIAPAKGCKSLVNTKSKSSVI